MSVREPSGAVGVFGGSFDPPHVAHVMLAAYALSVAPIERVLIVPTFRHPFGKPLAPYEHRVAMCERAFGVLTRTTVSRIEEEIGGDSYTVRTLERLLERMPGVSMRLLIGADVLPDTPRWREFDRVAALAPPFVIGRGGSARQASAARVEDDVPDLPAISSTVVRDRYAAGVSVEQLVPREVDTYVRAHGLYGSAPP